MNWQAFEIYFNIVQICFSENLPVNMQTLNGKISAWEN